MYHNILLQRDHPQHGQLEKAIELLLSFSIANTIYFSTHLEEGVNEGLIILMISEDSPYCWYELTEQYWKVFQGFPGFTFRIFDGSWMEESLKEGNPFFAIHCNHNTLVYSTADSTEIALVTQLKPKRFLKEAKAAYRMDDHAAFSAGLNVKYHRKNGDYLQAMFQVHQNIMWLVKAAEWFLSGEWIANDDLGMHQSRIALFSNALGRAFDLDNVEEKTLLDALNDSCATVRNGSGTTTFSQEQVDAAVAKKEWIRMEVARLFSACRKRCQYELGSAKAPLVAIADDDPLKAITRIITQAVAVSALYCFGKKHSTRSTAGCVLDAHEAEFQTTHYYLFLIVKDYQSDIPGNLSHMIKEHTNGRCTATVVMHSKKSLRQKEGDQQYFFHQIMERAQLLFKESTNPPYLPFDKVPARHYPSAKIYLHQRIRTASFLQEAEGMDGGGATKIHVYLMRLVVEQTCLGLIRLFLGYTPHQYSLQYLFELCEYFTPLTSEIFPRETDKDKEFLKILSGSTTSLRRGYIDDVHTHDYEVLSNRYNEFVDRSDKLIAKELERIELLNENNNQNN